METVKINIVPKGAVKAAHASQGDAPRVVRFELFDELLPYTLDGDEDITLTVVRPDTEEIVSSVTNTEEAYIDVSFTSEMTAIRGVANCEIKISKSGAEIGSHNFDLNIERDAYGEDITVETAQGVIATFTTGVIDNLVGLKTTFEPSQDLHGYNTPWIDSNVVNKAPYLSRALAGTASRIGNYEFNKLVGGTYAFNQILKNGNFSDTSNWAQSGSTLSVNNNTGLMTATTVNGNISQEFNAISGHKYLVKVNIKLTTETDKVRLNTYMPVSPYDSVNKFAEAITSEQELTLIISPINSRSYYCRIVDERTSNWDIIQIKNFNLFDLTQLFGSTIADYIYSLETAQAGAGVSFFKALFNKDYYPYNAGELMSVKTSSHNTIGFNQWNEVWELGGINYSNGQNQNENNCIRSKDYIPVIPNARYFFKAPTTWSATSIRGRCYDKDKNYIQALTITTNTAFNIPNNCYFFRFSTPSGATVTTYNNDICINLSDLSRNGEYEPYVIHSYALDPDLELRGIPKLDANNNLYYDGDTYESNGDVTRRYGIVDLGSLGWNYVSSNQTFYSTSINDFYCEQNVSTKIYNCINIKYPTTSRSSLYDEDKKIALSWSDVKYINIKDSDYTDAATFKASLSGVYLVYELDTPTTESADPFTDPQEIDASGSEEFIDARAVSIPVGHESYYANICEIEGIDEINLSHTGVNLWGGEKMADAFVNARTYSKDTSAKTFTFDVYPIAPYNETILKGCFKPNTQYTFILRYTAANDNNSLRIIYSDGTRLAFNLSTANTKTDYILTSAIGKTIKEISLTYYSDGLVTVYYDESGLFEGVKTIDEYKAYTGESALVEIGQEVYGGYYDKDLGIVLTSKLVNLGSLSFGAGFGGFFTGDIKNEIKIVTYLETPNLLSSAYKAIAYINLLTDINTVAIVYGGADYVFNGFVVFNDTRYPDAASFKAGVNGVTLCYELADPIIIPADAVNFETVKGVNNVWSDTNGETEVKYYVKEA